MNRNWIEKKICEKGATQIPSNLKIEEDDEVVRITLNANKIRDKNMQESGNDFEGWCIATYACAQKIVIMGVDDEISIDGEYHGIGHLCRFLYRAMKFSEQYKWFLLSENLTNEVEKFKSYLHSHKFTNNIGSGEAGNKNNYDDENAVEAKMAEEGVLRSVVKSIDIGSGKVYRQLPVGLFEDSVSRKNAVFTGGKSAIDLWSIDGSAINVVELKTNNPMMGIITEVFFYSNYVYDLLMPDGLFTLNDLPKGNADHRGYEEIWNNRKRINMINGIMLADNERFHPWIDEELRTILNDNGLDVLNYFIESYHLQVIIE